MAWHVMLYLNVLASVLASPEDTDTVPYDDQESFRSDKDSVEFTRMCFFVVERGNHQHYVEDLLSLKQRLCRQGSHLVADSKMGCCVSLDWLQIENIIRNIAVRVERTVMQNSHRKKIPFVATCKVILERYGQPWQREATNSSTDFLDFGVVPTMETVADLIEKRKREEGFDNDNLKLEMKLEQFVNGCKRSRAC